MVTEIVPISRGRDRLMRMARAAQEAFDRFILTKDGVPQAVLISYDEFEGWLETLEICRDRRIVREIKKAERLADRRKTRPFEDVLGKTPK